MNYRYPYAQDAHPPGIPAGYPYGPRPMPSSNPMIPTAPYLQNNPAYPSAGHYPAYPSSPYPSVPSSNPTSTAYPPTSCTQPTFSPSVPYPPTSSVYPGFVNTSTMPYPSTVPSQPPSYSPYPTGPNMHAGHYPPTGPTSGSTGQRHFQGQKSHAMAQFAVSSGTVRPFPGFDAQQDAQALRKAMKGLGTDEKAIINVLTKRSNGQRVYIAIAYKQLFGKDLIDDLKSELSGNFEDVIVGLMTPTNDYLASEVHRAISGIGTDEDVLIEVLCTQTNQEIWGINESYRRLYGKNLEDDIKSDTSGHFERLLVSTCTGVRSEAPADETRAKQKAHELYAAGVGKWGTDESTFNAILVAESFQQLAYTFYEYQKLAGHTVSEAIDKELSGDLKKGMLAISRCVENRPLYFADKLYKAMKGLGTDDRTLIRIIVSRCEIDMIQIKAEYERSFGKPLADAIKGDTSGDYRRVLIALVDGY